MKDLKEKFLSFINELKEKLLDFLKQKEIKEKILVFSFIVMALSLVLLNITMFIKLAIFLKCGKLLAFAIFASLVFGSIYLWFTE